MSEKLRRGYHWLSMHPHQRRGLRALQIALGMMLLFRVATEVRFAAFLWGPHGIGQGSSGAFLSQPLAAWMDRLYGTELGIYGMLVVLSAGAVGLVLGHHTRLAALAALVGVRFFESRLPELGDGGDNVARLVLTYMVFALPAARVARSGSLAVWFHNVAVLAIGLQIGVLYLTSGFLKATGEHWSNGTALYIISQVEWFANPHFQQLFRNPTFTALATYMTVFFQVWFPVAVLTRLKPLWLGAGICMHLGIAMFMGLIGFSIAMIGLELFLISDREYATIQAAGRGWLSRARHCLPFIRTFAQRALSKGGWSPARIRGKMAR
jgi:hypothetical protein